MSGINWFLLKLCSCQPCMSCIKSVMWLNTIQSSRTLSQMPRLCPRIYMKMFHTKQINRIYQKNNRINFPRYVQFIHFIHRDDTHMTSMKIIQFSRPPTPFSIYVQNSFTLLILDVQFQTNPPPLPLNDKQSIKRKHNPRMTIICYQILPSGRLSFSVSTH